MNEKIPKIIEAHSDYNPKKPYWIDLPSNDVNIYGEELDDEIKQKLSDALNEYFKENGPDAEEDFTDCQSRLMTYETAEAAVTYAIAKVGIMEIPEGLICGGYSIETDGREIDPVTSELLHAYPVHAASIIEELEYMKEEDKLSEDDWRFIHMCENSFKCCSHMRTQQESDKIEALITEIVLKFGIKENTE